MPPHDSPPTPSVTTASAPAFQVRPIKKSGSGPTIGIIIILILMMFAGLYFWGAQLNKEAPGPLPLIPGDSAVSS